MFPRATCLSSSARHRGRLNEQLVHIAPGPILPALIAAHDRMARAVEVFGRVLPGRAVAASDVAAGHAHAQVNPAAAGRETFGAAVRRVGLGGAELGDVKALGRQGGLSEVHGSRHVRAFQA